MNTRNCEPGHTWARDGPRYGSAHCTPVVSMYDIILQRRRLHVFADFFFYPAPALLCYTGWYRVPVFIYPVDDDFLLSNLRASTINREKALIHLFKKFIVL